MVQRMLWCIAPLWTAVSAGTLGAQGTTGAITGTIRDTAGRTVGNVVIRVTGTNRGAQSDSLGRYQIARLDSGAIQLTAIRLGYRRYSQDSIQIRPGQTTHFDIVLQDGGRARRAVRFPCPAGQRAPDGGACLGLRPVGTFCGMPAGIGIIRDEVSWNAVRRRFGKPRYARRIDWSTEMILLESFGPGLMELEEDWELNRVAIRSDTLIVTLGPDSLVGQPKIFEDGWIPSTAYAIARSTFAVRYEAPIESTWIPREVDWRRVADTTKKTPRVSHER
jgi:hypothetical protein